MSDIERSSEYVLARSLVSDPLNAHSLSSKYDHPSKMALDLGEHYHLNSQSVNAAIKYATESAENFPQWLLAYCYVLSNGEVLEFSGFPFALEEVGGFFLYNKTTDGRHTKEVASELYQFDMLPFVSAITGDRVWSEVDVEWRAEVGVMYTLKCALINSVPAKLLREQHPDDFNQHFSEAEVNLAEQFQNENIPDSELKRFYSYTKEWTLDGVIDNILRAKEDDISDDTLNAYLESISSFDEIDLSYIFPDEYRGRFGASRPGLFHFSLTGSITCNAIKLLVKTGE